MPIKSLQIRSTRPAIPIVGRLWKGTEKRDGRPKNGKPTKIMGLDLKTHFRFTSPIPGATAAFAEAFGEKPVNIPFFFPFATVDDNFDTWQEAYTSQRLQHRCDGEFVTRYRDMATKKYINPPAGSMKCPGGCDYVGRLSLLIPDFVRRGYAGAVNLTLGGHNEVPMLYEELHYYYEQRGDLSKLEFVLYRYPKSITTPDGPRVEKWLVGLKPNAQFVMAMIEGQTAQPLAAGGNMALAAGDQPLALPEGDFEDADELEDSAENLPDDDHDDDAEVVIGQSIELRERFDDLVAAVYNGDGEARRGQFRTTFKVDNDDDYDDEDLGKLIKGLEKKLAKKAAAAAKAELEKPRWLTKYTDTLIEAYPDGDERNKAEANHCRRCNVPEMMDALDEQLELLVNEMRGFIEARAEQAPLLPETA